MKTNIPSRLLRILSAAFLVFALSGANLRAADDDSNAIVKLSAPGKPATFVIDMPWADIRIVGVDGDTVTVSSSLNQKSSKPARPGALRRLDNEVSFELVEKDNVVTLGLTGDNPWGGHDAEFKISVPRSIALNLKTDAGGDLVVQGVEGDIEINNMNGEVKIDGLVGSAVINTMNGEVRAIYARVPQKPISITSMNGEVDLRVPADTKANIRLRTHNGSILTDFSEEALKTKSEGGSKHSYTYVHGSSEETRQIAREAAQAAREAVQVAREVTRAVQQEVSRAVQEEVAAATPVAPRAPVTPRPARAPRAPMAPIIGGKVVSGTLNGGGADINISSMNGEITLRQSK